jgi:hypothetical protein
VLVPREVKPEGVGGDDMERESGKVEAAMTTKAGQALAKNGG